MRNVWTRWVPRQGQIQIQTQMQIQTQSWLEKGSEHDPCPGWVSECCDISKCEDATLRGHSRGQGWHSRSHASLGVSRAQQGSWSVPTVMERVTAAN